MNRDMLFTYRMRYFLLAGLMTLTSGTSVAEEPLRLAQAGRVLKFVSQVVPENMEGGNAYTVLLQFKNTSRSRLGHGSSYLLKPADRGNSRTWGITRVRMKTPAAIDAGEMATWQFRITAPRREGNYSFQWQVFDSDGRSISDPSPEISITVRANPADNKSTDAEFIFQKIPGLKKAGQHYAIVESGQSYPVTIMFRNSGGASWSSANTRLVAVDKDAELTWAIDHVELKEGDEVKSGEYKAFNFTILTPLEPGIYNFQWQLQRGRDEWFGPKTDPVAITVR